MKIFRCSQIKEIDEFTIINEPVSSIDLMERAARQLFIWLIGKFGRSDRFVIFTGPGNNGGDGLALARMLIEERYKVDVFYVYFTDRTSEDWNINRLRLEKLLSEPINILKEMDQFPLISTGDIIIDAIFGSGLSRPVDGFPGNVIKQISALDATVISVDIPSGLFGEDNSSNNYKYVLRADYTLSFQFPKLSFLFSENSPYVGEWQVLPIGLEFKAVTSTPSPYYLTEKSDVSTVLKLRNRFDHKGIFGHGLLISGSSGKMGAAVLSAGAAMRTGIGLITCHTPSCGVTILQSAVPEAMVIADPAEDVISDIADTESFSAVGIGPGIGTKPISQKAMYSLLTECKKPMVLDADALNILSINKSWLSLIPSGSVLTPHPKEFDRLAGFSTNSYERLTKQIRFSKDHNCVVVLKGAYSSVSTPEGNVMFNTTGNPGMATAGSGDVLTGIILSLLAQGYSAENAALLGVYLHGTAGDIAAGESGMEAVIASDIINRIGDAFNVLKGIK